MSAIVNSITNMSSIRKGLLPTVHPMNMTQFSYRVVTVTSPYIPLAEPSHDASAQIDPTGAAKDM